MSCSKYQDIYISKGGKIADCGSAKNPCRSLPDALKDYHKMTGKTWISCVRIHLDGPEKLHGFNGTGLHGFGDSTYSRGQHTHIQVLPWKTRFSPKSNPAILIQEVNFEHVQLSIEGMNTNVSDCNFKDSAMVIQNIQSSNITRCNWTETSNITLLDARDITYASIEACEISDTILEYTNDTKDLLHLENLKHMTLHQVVMNNSRTSIDRTKYPDPMKHILALVRISNSTSTELSSIQITNSTLDDENDYYGAALFLMYTGSNISQSTFSHTKGRALAAMRCNLTVSHSAFNFNNYIGFQKDVSDYTVGGAAIYAENGTFFITHSNFRHNKVSNPGAGGAMFLQNINCLSDHILMIHNCLFESNSAGFGGAVQAIHTPLYMEGCTFKSNNAFLQAGALYLDSKSNYILIPYTIHNCTFDSNSNSEGYGGAVVSRNTPLHIEGSIFTSNTALYHAGAICLESTTKHKETVNTIHNCVFHRNSGQVNGAILSIDTPLHVDSCAFISNGANSTNGGAISLITSDNGDISSIVSNSKFHSNSASSGAAIQSLNTKVHIAESNFTSNRANSFGGAISLAREKHHSYILCTINDCKFENNTSLQGGAISSWNTSLHIHGCNFTSNSAKTDLGSGGGVNCFAQELCEELVIMNTVFHNNHANMKGGSLQSDRCDAHLENVTITANQIRSYEAPQIDIMRSYRLYLMNVVLEINQQANYPQFLENLKFTPILSAYVFLAYKGFTMICPPDYQAVFQKDHRPMTNPNIAPCSEPTTECDDITFKCQLVLEGNYILGNGKLHVRNRTVFYENHVAKPCPIPGGNCTKGLRPLDGFWGPHYAKKDTASFIKCAPELCCFGSDCKDNTSCNSEHNRAGILCTKCKANHSESLFTEKCIDNNKCNSIWPFVVVPLLVILIVTFSVFFGVQKYVTKFYGFVSVMFKGFHGDLKAISKPECHNKPNTSNNSELNEEDIGTRCLQPEKQFSAFVLAVFTIFYYTQDVTLYHVDLAPYHPPWQKIFDVKVIQNIFNLQAQLLGVITKETCISKSMTPVGKIFLTISLYPFIYITFLGIYIIVFKLIPKCKRPNSCLTLNQKIGASSSKIKLNLATGLMIVTMLSYQNVTKLALKMMKCVEVDEKVLLLDYNTKCYEWWQYFVGLYIVTCSIPFPIYLIFRPNSVKRQVISVREFLVGLILPGPLIMWGLVKQVISKFRNGHNKSQDISREMPSDIERIESESGTINNSSGIEEINEDTPLLHGEHKNEPEDNNLQEALCQNVQGGYKLYLNGWLNWAGIILLLRMILVFLSVLVSGTLSRI